MHGDWVCMDVGCTFQPVNIKTITQYFSVASPSWTVMNVASDVKQVMVCTFWSVSKDLYSVSLPTGTVMNTTNDVNIRHGWSQDLESVMGCTFSACKPRPLIYIYNSNAILFIASV